MELRADGMRESIFDFWNQDDSCSDVFDLQENERPIRRTDDSSVCIISGDVYRHLQLKSEIGTFRDFGADVVPTSSGELMRKRYNALGMLNDFSIQCLARRISKTADECSTSCATSSRSVQKGRIGQNRGETYQNLPARVLLSASPLHQEQPRHRTNMSSLVRLRTKYGACSITPSKIKAVLVLTPDGDTTSTPSFSIQNISQNSTRNTPTASDSYIDTAFILFLKSLNSAYVTHQHYYPNPRIYWPQPQLSSPPELPTPQLGAFTREPTHPVGGKGRDSRSTCRPDSQ